MPNIPNLPVLLAMIFAPDMILQRNSDNTRFVNIQFGLGAHEEDGRAFFEEHDCILPVDFALDETDFYDVNLLRFLMSYLLMTQPNQQMPILKVEEKFETLVTIKETIMKILGKSRLPLATAHVSYNQQGWRKDDQSDSKIWKEKFEDGGNYHQIRQPRLEKENPTKIHRLIKQLEEVERDVKK
jgi:hypothetical protein